MCHRFPTIVLMLWTCYASAGDYIVIPHIPSDTGSFQSRLVFENRGSINQNMLLLAYNGSELVDTKTIHLEAAARQSGPVEDYFPGRQVTHIFADKRPSLFAGVAYISVQNSDNRTFVEGIREFTNHWRVHPSNWKSTFDGLVIVNPLCYETSVTIRQRAADGSEIASHSPVSDLQGFHKLTYNLGQMFEEHPGSYIEILTSHPVAVMGLKGSLVQNQDFSFLVGNPAEASPRSEGMLRDVSLRRQIWFDNSLAGNYSFQYQHSCFCPGNPLVQVTVSGHVLNRMTYVEGGADVALAESRVYHTIEELFDLIESAVRDADGVEVTWDAEWGYPSTIVIDWNSCSIDEEDIISISNLSRLDP